MARLDVSRLTLGEIAKVEDLSGLSISQLGEDTTPAGKFTAALVFVAARRQGQTPTWAECLDMDMETAHRYLGDDEDDEAAEGEPAPLDESDPETTD